MRIRIVFGSRGPWDGHLSVKLGLTTKHKVRFLDIFILKKKLIRYLASWWHFLSKLCSVWRSGYIRVMRFGIKVQYKHTCILSVQITLKLPLFQYRLKCIQTTVESLKQVILVKLSIWFTWAHGAVYFHCTYHCDFKTLYLKRFNTSKRSSGSYFYVFDFEIMLIMQGRSLRPPPPEFSEF